MTVAAHRFSFSRVWPSNQAMSITHLGSLSLAACEQVESGFAGLSL
jgi:hypothetical protein